MSWRQVAATVAILCGALFVTVGTAAAQKDLRPAPLTPVTVQTLPAHKQAARPLPTFDPQKATNAYLARVSGEARARSDSYFEGGYVLILVDGLYAVGVAALLLWSGFSARMRSVAQSITRSRFWQVPLYVGMFILVTTVLTFPLTVYEQFLREHAYGLSNQNFVQWFRDFAVALVVQLIATAFALTIIYSVVRAAPRRWWAWGTLVTVILFGFFAMVGPVFISPLFNHYTPLPES